MLCTRLTLYAHRFVHACTGPFYQMIPAENRKLRHCRGGRPRIGAAGCCGGRSCPAGFKAGCEKLVLQLATKRLASEQGVSKHSEEAVRIQSTNRMEYERLPTLSTNCLRLETVTKRPLKCLHKESDWRQPRNHLILCLNESKELIYFLLEFS